MPPKTTAQLALVAQGMHNSAGVSYPVTFGISVSGLQVTTTPSVSCGGPCPTFTYDWNWGEGPNTSTNPGVHTYGTGGSKSITLTVFLQSNGKKVGSATRSVTLANPDMPPVAAGTCTPDTNAWTMTIVDNSSDDGPDADTLPPDG